MIEVKAINAPEAYRETLYRLRLEGEEEDSRNGKVLAFQDPFLLTILKPNERVLFDPVRDANPFFHLMEAIWMFAGEREVGWIEQFNKRYRQYADGDIVHGAYGHRWINHFGLDQIMAVVKLLKDDRTTRRAVLGMWDPSVDLSPHNDLPCNTNIYFRCGLDNELDMTVCNRSNDVVWGMLGANVVHMTMLQELVAHAVGVPIGIYRVFSNNAHIYKGLDKYEEIIETRRHYDPYDALEVEPQPLLQSGEHLGDFLLDSHDFVHNAGAFFRTQWFKTVASPLYMAFRERKSADSFLDMVTAKDWKRACQEWLKRRS